MKKCLLRLKFIADYGVMMFTFMLTLALEYKTKYIEISQNKLSLKKIVYVGNEKTNQFQSFITKLYQKDRINEGFYA